VIGAALACFYTEFPPETAFGPRDGDKVFAHFIVNHLGRGLVGLILSAVFAAAMSTLSGSLNSSATALINDLYLPLTRSQPSAGYVLKLSRIATVAFGLIQIGIALASYRLGTSESTVNSVLKIAGFALGPLLGLYLVGIFTKRVQQRAALGGFCVGVACLSYIAFQTNLAWPWYAGVGAGITFGAGVLLSTFVSEPSKIDSHLS
jgi:Na+/proline symporter